MVCKARLALRCCAKHGLSVAHVKEKCFRPLLDHAQSTDCECRLSLVELQKCPADIFISISALFWCWWGSVAWRKSNFAQVKSSETKGECFLQPRPESSTREKNVCYYYLEAISVGNNLKYLKQRFSRTQRDLFFLLWHEINKRALSNLFTLMVFSYAMILCSLPWMEANDLS